jgi:hypothetical protein
MNIRQRNYSHLKNVIFSLLILAATNARAQTDNSLSSRLGVFAGPGVAIGVHSGNYLFGGIIGVKFEHPIKSSSMSLIGSVAYNFFVSNESISFGPFGDGTSETSVASFIPVKIGARLYAGKLYVEAEVGTSFNINSNTVKYTNHALAVVVSPAIGYAFRLGREKKKGLDLALTYQIRMEPRAQYEYNLYGNYSQFIITLAYKWAL